MDFGANLRQARERRGISLRQIATATKISVSALEALEKNDISRLPGGIFTRAFVRSYAAEIGLDPEQTVREFLTEFPLASVADGSPYVHDSHENDTFESHQRMAGTLLWLVVLSVPVAVVISYFGVTGRTPGAEPLPPEGEPTAAVATAAAPGRAEPPLAVEGAAAGPATAAPLLVEPTVTGPLTIDIHPQAACWVSLIVDGERIFSRVMQAGEREVQEARREIILNVGDAGAFAFEINRRPGRRLGERGEVVTARINRDNYRNFVIQ